MIPDLDRRLWLGSAHGEPAPQGSKSVDRRGIMYEQNRNTRPWRRTMVDAFAAYPCETPIDEPVEVRATFVLTRPGRPKFKLGHGVKPDVDKLQRNLGDALQAARVLLDDSRIAEWHVRKVYATERLRPGVHVEILRYDPSAWPLLHTVGCAP